MTKYVKDLKPNRVEDLMAMVALYRPGPIAVIPEYIARKNNPKLVSYLDPRMEKFLGASYGLIVYQDDLLLDRKSTRLNSSHQIISYAVFCLKKKKDYLMSVYRP